MDEVTVGLHKWEKEGTVLKGIKIGHEQRQTTKGPAQVYEIETPDGTVTTFAPTDLHKKLKNVPNGWCVILEQGKTERTQSGNDFKNFIVKKGEANEKNLKEVGMEGWNANSMSEEGGGDNF